MKLSVTGAYGLLHFGKFSLQPPQAKMQHPACSIQGYNYISPGENIFTNFEDQIGSVDLTYKYNNNILTSHANFKM